MQTGAPLLAALIVMSVSLIGVVFARGALGAWINRYLTYLATFSGGVFLVIAYFLAEEAVHEGGWIVGVSSVILGAAIMEGIRFVFPNEHHHHGTHDEHGHSSIDGRQVLLSDAMHNIGDGILLVGAFAADLYVGIAATVGVVLHETVQEISEYFVLRGAGYSNTEALVRNVAVSSSILLGLLFATYLASIPMFLSILSGIAAGGFLSVVLHDLVPHAIASIRSGGGAYVHGFVAVLGVSLMMGVQSIIPHEHEEAAPDEIATMVETSATIQVEPAQNEFIAEENTPVETTPTTPVSSGLSTDGGTAASSAATSTDSSNEAATTPGSAPTQRAE